MCRDTNDKASYKALYRGIKPEQRQISLHLATEIMLCRYHFNARENLEHILSFYELHFDLEPLRALGIVTPSEERMLATRERNENNPKMQPSSVAMNIVIRIYARRRQTQQSIRRVYNAFQEMLTNRHPIICPLVSTTHAYNEFLKAMCRTPRTVMTWRNIIRDMKRPLPDPPSIQAVPNLQTWNIILNSCMTSALYDEARKVWNTLRMEGHEPDAVTWNTRLDGFSKRQHVAAVADTLKRMLAAGVEPDRVTAKALDRIKQKELLRKEIVQGQWGSIDAWIPVISRDASSDADHAETLTLDSQANAHDTTTSSSSIRTVLGESQVEVKAVNPNLQAAELIMLARKALEDYRVEKRKRRRRLTLSSKVFRRLELAQRLNRFQKYYFHGWRYRLRGPRASTRTKSLKPSSHKLTSVRPRRLLSKPRQLTNVRPRRLLSSPRQSKSSLKRPNLQRGAGKPHTKRR